MEPVSLGRQQQRRTPGARNPRRGSREGRSLAQGAKSLMTASRASTMRARPRRRPPRAGVRVDRRRRQLLGLTVTSIANTIRTNVAGTQAAMYRGARQRVPDRRPIARIRAPTGDRRPGRAGHHDGGQAMPAKNLVHVENETGPVQIERKNQQRIVTVSAEPEATLSDAVKAVSGSTAAARRLAGLQRRLRAQRSRNRPRRSISSGWC